MRILHCIWRMGTGGAERQLIHLTGALTARGNDVHAVSVFPAENDAALAEAGATLHAIPASGKFDPRIAARLARLMRRVRPDAMNSWLTQMDILGALAAPFGGVPRAVSERSSAAAYPSGALHRARIWSGKRAAAIIANSEGGREYWRQYVDEARIHVIPNIVPKNDAQPASHEQLRDGDDVVLFVGRLSAEKNLERLLDALAIVTVARPLKAVFCGHGILRQRLEQKARALGIDQHCLFLGTVGNVPAWMKRAAVVVAVSIFEGEPNAVLEAIAAGAPLVLSDIPAHRALLGDDSAFIVEPSSPRSIANGIAAALGDRAAAATRAARAGNAIAARSAGEIAARYEDVYRSIARRSN